MHGQAQRLVAVGVDVDATRLLPKAAGALRDWMVESDAATDAQAWVLRPDIAVEIAQSIVDAPDHYAAGCAAAKTALKALRSAHANGALHIAEREQIWLDAMDEAVAALPGDESRFIDQMLAEVDTSRFILAEYGL